MAYTLIAAELVGIALAAITFMYPIAVIYALLVFIALIIAVMMAKTTSEYVTEHQVAEKLSSAVEDTKALGVSLFNRVSKVFA